MAGYSGTPLSKKLGVKPGTAIAVLGAPERYLEALDLPPGARVQLHARGAPAVIQLFVTRRAELAKKLPQLVKPLPPDGALWVSWPKGKQKAALPTDLDDGLVRELGLSAGLVDVKVCAVDEVWSGLKFAYRLKDRASRTPRAR